MIYQFYSFGFIFFRERFTKIQIIAVFFAFFAIFLLSLGINSLPLISIIMGVTFAIYGMIKKKMDLNPLKTVFIEIALLSPLALAFLLFISKKNPELINPACVQKRRLQKEFPLEVTNGFSN